MCGKFSLLAHIDGIAPSQPNDPTWVQTDYFILSWMYGLVAADVLDATMEPNQGARNLWVAIEEQFHNKEQRATYVSNQFHTLVQGDMTISDYFQRLMLIIDSLRDLSYGVTDPQLILNMIHGLDPRFSNQADLLGAKDLFPTFSARSTL
ncbi:uncharacterized protein LOC133908006 [Phragmites australis]|uniref:uncharacterized protein LOC133908006 n=1 Tax=Phragmites australis TaxID=29695 RepID=UPI002D78C3B2|nr:uncharacterized protein LOC133908006 [Phragmites australis]